MVVRALLSSCFAVGLTACSTVAPPPPASISLFSRETVPREQRPPEPPSRSGNRAFYRVRGREYAVWETSAGYRQRGLASWYGPGFHGRPTASGQPYDMHDLSAAHRSLPIPTYAQVTNLQNGRQVVVRINDRGPFVGDERIIDLSYGAARALGMVNQGIVPVEVVALPPYQQRVRSSEDRRVATAPH